MINRRTLIAMSSAGIVAATSGSRLGFAQDADPELPLQNASFIRDLDAPAEATPSATPSSDTAMDDFHGYILGDPEAPNTLQIYSDYRCPYCRVFHVEMEPGLIEDFVATGRLNLELIDFTVVGVQSLDELDDDSIESVQAAEAAAAAAEQNAFLAYREWLYSGEERTTPGDFSDENLIAAAEELGLDADQFAASLLDGVYENDIIASVHYGLERGVSGTPTLILDDGEPFFAPNAGYGALKEMLEDRLQ